MKHIDQQNTTGRSTHTPCRKPHPHPHSPFHHNFAILSMTGSGCCAQARNGCSRGVAVEALKTASTAHRFTPCQTEQLSNSQLQTFAKPEKSSGAERRMPLNTYTPRTPRKQGSLQIVTHMVCERVRVNVNVCAWGCMCVCVRDCDCVGGCGGVVACVGSM
jgi:hypothetical protein